MKIFSCKNFNSQNSLSSLDTIDSPVFDKIQSQKKTTSRPFLNSIISKEELRSTLDNFSGKSSLHNLDSLSKPKNIFKIKKQQIPTSQELLDLSSDDDQIIPQFYNTKYLSSQQNCCIDDDFENESDSDEYNIWDNSDALEMGIDIENIEIPFEFCQLYYIRSQLYQNNRVSKNNVLDEVQVISNMCRKKMNIVQSNKLIDSIEKNYHVTLKKNAIQVSKIKMQKSQTAKSQMELGRSISQKQTPKAFQISQYKLFKSPIKQTKQTISSNIFDQDISPIYSNGRQLQLKSSMNRISNESLQAMPILKSSSYPEVSQSKISSPQKKVRILVNQKISSRIGGAQFSLGQTMSHSKFYPNQEINV